MVGVSIKWSSPQRESSGQTFVLPSEIDHEITAGNRGRLIFASTSEQIHSWGPVPEAGPAFSLVALPHWVPALLVALYTFSEANFVLLFHDFCVSGRRSLRIIRTSLMNPIIILPGPSKAALSWKRSQRPECYWMYTHGSHSRQASEFSQLFSKPGTGAAWSFHTNQEVSCRSLYGDHLISDSWNLFVVVKESVKKVFSRN